MMSRYSHVRDDARLQAVCALEASIARARTVPGKAAAATGTDGKTAPAPPVPSPAEGDALPDHVVRLKPRP